MQKKLNVYHII